MNDERIRQFQQMTDSDPENELGHFSLGKACLEAGRYADAAASLTRALELNPAMSRAFQLLGEAHDRAGDRARAVEVVTRGVTVADAQGDRKPRDAMMEMLRSWGAAAPSLPPKETAAESTPDDGTAAAFRCARCGSPRGRLPKAPFKGALGEKVLARVCAPCWREWIPTGTKVINELGLVLSTPQGQRAYDQYMVEFLQLEDD